MTYEPANRPLAVCVAFKRLMTVPEMEVLKAGAVITLVYVVGMVLIWFAPETKGKPLPD